MMLQWVLIGLGGFAGAISRFVIGRLAIQRWGMYFPYGTLIVNLVGSLLLGLFAGSVSRDSVVWVLGGIGFMGAFTTFSTFKMESAQYAADKLWFRLGVYWALSYTLGIGLAYVGFILAA